MRAKMGIVPGLSWTARARWRGGRLGLVVAAVSVALCAALIALWIGGCAYRRDPGEYGPWFAVDVRPPTWVTMGADLSVGVWVDEFGCGIGWSGNPGSGPGQPAGTLIGRYISGPVWVLGVFAAAFAVLAALLVRRWRRYEPGICLTCGHKIGGGRSERGAESDSGTPGLREAELPARSGARRRLRWGSVCAVLIVGAAWLGAARWTVWYAWSVDRASMPMRIAHVWALRDGGVACETFHPISIEEHVVGSPGWHTAHGTWRFGLERPSYSAREYRSALWFPLWPVFVGVSALTAIIWAWPKLQVSGHCRHCGYDLTGNVSGRCPECGTETAGR